MKNIVLEKFGWDLRSYLFPYCMEKLGKDEWVILNRHYKPVGFPGGNWYEYEDFSVKGLRFTKKQLQKLSFRPLKEDDERIYFYNDGCVPTQSKKNMGAYLEKLSLLMGKKGV